MSDYTIEMFRRDYEKVVPLLIKYQDQEKQTAQDSGTKPEYAVLDMVKHFAEQYGNARGTDYHMRFLSVLQFIEHYRKDLLDKGLLEAPTEENVRLSDNFLGFLLDSIKPPQPPSPYPSSPLYNQGRKFNYKKVIKAFKPG